MSEEIKMRKNEELPCEYRQLFDKIDALLFEGRAIVAIDGGSGGGKTTLAHLLQRVYDCNVFHMDDFFLRPEQRTSERLAEVGGNLDRERFLEEVLQPLRRGETVCYRRYDCATQTLGEPITVASKALTVVEGVYAMHEAFGAYFDLAVFLEIDKETQKTRIQKRNTKALADRFFGEWIPMEDLYFEKMSVRSRADLLFFAECPAASAQKGGKVTTKRYKNAPNRKEIRELYTTAFPKEERLPFFALRLLSARRKCGVTAYYVDGVFAGFTYDAIAGDILYLMFFAVSDKLRGKGYGSAILSYLKKENKGKAIVLNIEPLDEKAENYEERCRRMRFYQKNGFFDTGCDIDEVGGTFRVLSTKKELDPSAYLAVFKKISFGIWRPWIRRGTTK